MKRILLTWASSGLGASIARVFHDDWYELVGLCWSKPADFVKWIETDLCDEDSLINATQNIFLNYPEFECLIHCAWILQVSWIENIDTKRTRDVFNINVIAPITITSELFSLIHKNSGDIVNIWSNIIKKNKEWFISYATSKWAINWFSENLRTELKWTPSRVISFNPGGMDTPIFEHASATRDTKFWDMDPNEVAKLLLQIMKLSKNMEVSEIIISTHWDTKTPWLQSDCNYTVK